MLDPLPILEALAAAAAVAALLALPGRRFGAVAVGLGFAAGAWVLGVVPKVPPVEDQDRLLVVLIPAAVLAEVVATFSRRAGMALRVAVAVVAGRVLLDGSAYITDAAGPGTREWSPTTAALVFGGLGGALAGVGAALAGLAERVPGRSVPLALAVVILGAGLTVQLSGYATGGQLGFPLAAAVAGAAVVSPTARGAVGIGVVGLFALLAAGRFFGSLTTANAVVLFAAPLLMWLPEWPRVRRLRGVLRVGLVLVPVAVVVGLAVRQFQAAYGGLAGTPAANPFEATADDYANYKP